MEKTKSMRYCHRCKSPITEDQRNCHICGEENPSYINEMYECVYGPPPPSHSLSATDGEEMYACVYGPPPPRQACDSSKEMEILDPSKKMGILKKIIHKIRGKEEV